jgi:acyl carrier protein
VCYYKANLPRPIYFQKLRPALYNNLICSCVQPYRDEPGDIPMRRTPAQLNFKKMNDINLRIQQFIKDKLGIEESAITANATFYGDLDVDSLDFCELIVDIEKEFDIVIPDDVYEKFKTVGSLVKYVSSQVHLPVAKEHLTV